MSYSIFAKEFEHENWDNFISVCDEYSEVIEALISKQDFHENIPEDLKKVAVFKLKTEASCWFLEEIPILDGERPIDILGKNEGLNAI